MICIGKFTKRHNSVQRVNGATVLVLCTLSDYFFIFQPSFVHVSQTTSELQTRTVGSTLGWSQFAMGHNSIKTVDGVNLISTNCLIMLFICTKFLENISECFTVIEQIRFAY